MAQATTKTVLIRILPFLGILQHTKNFTVVAAIIAIMAIIIVPLPSVVLDFLLVISISISVLIIMLSVFIEKPTDFSTYPTLILIITIFRLSLNIATTRMILSEGGGGGVGEVSGIIAAFGSVVVGGNYVIGIIIFIILIVINFIVITNGSTRVAEVSARFTLDALPGKQMAIDADLNAGLIDEKQAKERREEVLGESSFYGAMDGSAKFVKGDAVAGIIITLINIIGGILIGTFQNGLSISESASTFTLLTIGDGLVGQIPALLVSTATGIIITRSTKTNDNFAVGVTNQLCDDYRILFIVGSIMLLLAILPGMPGGSFGIIGMCFVALGLSVQNAKDGKVMAWFYHKFPKLQELKDEVEAAGRAEQSQQNSSRPQDGRATATASASDAPQQTQEEIEQEEEEVLAAILRTEMLEIDMGMGLLKLIDKKQGGDLVDKMRTMRRKVASDYGFVMPQIHIRDNISIDPKHYDVLLKGEIVASGQVEIDKLMIMNTGLVIDEMHGIETTEPAFGLKALLVDKHQREEAISEGYVVVDPTSMITTHVTEVIKAHAEELLTRQDAQKLLDELKKEYPNVVSDALESTSLGLITQILRGLLREKIPIKDMLTIMETIADLGGSIKSLPIILEQVRARLARTISGMYKSENGQIKTLVIGMDTEPKLTSAVRDENGRLQLNINVRQINLLMEETRSQCEAVLSRGISPVILITDPMIRQSLVEIYDKFKIPITVLSWNEIDKSAGFEVLGTINIEDF